MTDIKEKLDAKTHVYRDDPVIAGEQVILSQFLRPGMAVLDVGCGAIGRSARLLESFGCKVYTIDVNASAIGEFQARDDSREIVSLIADTTQLPFPADFFDLVLVAMHGLDYLIPESNRIIALQEIRRVMKSDTKSHLVFNTLNPVGVILSPRGLLEPGYWKWRLRYLLSLGFLKPTLHDSHGIEMYQSLPTSVVSQVEERVGLKFLYAINQGGTTRNLALLALFSTGPYYVFESQPSENQTEVSATPPPERLPAP